MPVPVCKFPVKSTSQDACRFTGSFAPAGTGAPTDLKGKGFTVAYGGATGKFTLTLDGVFQSLVSETYSRSFDTATTDAWSLSREGALDTSTTAGKTIITLVYVQNGAAANIAANASRRVSFDIEVEPLWPLA